MNDVALASLVSGGFVVLGALITTGANLWFNHRLERERLRAGAAQTALGRADWYRRALFERRLAAVQRADTWIRELYVGLTSVEVGHVDPNSDEALELLRIGREAHDWYDEHVLYHDELPGGSAFVGLTRRARSPSGPRAVRSRWRVPSTTRPPPPTR